MTGGVAGGWADLGSLIGLDGVLKNEVGGLNVLGAFSDTMDSLLDPHVAGGGFYMACPHNLLPLLRTANVPDFL